MDAKGHGLAMAKFATWRCPTCGKGGATHHKMVAGVYTPTENLIATETPAGSGNWTPKHYVCPT